MLPFFPKQISNRAIIVYLSALAIVSLVYFDYAMKVGYYVLGVVWVSAFFYLTANWSQRWQISSNKDYLKSLIWVAVWKQKGRFHPKTYWTEKYDCVD